MRKSTIDKLCEAFNKKYERTYPMPGFLRFADIKGDGRNRRNVYIIVNEGGGVAAIYNGATYRETAANLRSVLEA